MLFWLIVVVIIILGYFAFSIYRHEDTMFCKMTGYTYFDLLVDSRVRVLNKVMNTLDSVEGTHKVLVDLKVPSEGTTQSIDGLLIHESGIYVMNVKKAKGWINGREEDPQWVQLLHNDKQEPFENPIHRVQRAIFALQGHLPEINQEAYEALVLFTDDCSFQQITLNSQNVDVLKPKDLKDWTKTLDGHVLSETEINTIYSVLAEMAQKKKVKLTRNAKAVSMN